MSDLRDFGVRVRYEGRQNADADGNFERISEPGEMFVWMSREQTLNLADNLASMLGAALVRKAA